MAKNLRYGTNEAVTIASSSSTATTWTLEQNRVPVAIVMPSTFTGTQVTFQASIDGGATFYDLYDEGTRYAVAVATNAARFIAVKEQPFHGVRYLRLVSSGTETASRTIYCISGEY